MDELRIRKSVAEVLEVLPEELTEDVELESFVTCDSTAQLSLKQTSGLVLPDDVMYTNAS